MGDLFFLLKMTIYTVIIVVIMQVKVGPTTLEQKVIHWTHNSQAAGVLQNIARGATTFVGVQYRNLTGHVKSRFVEQNSATQIPGQRLKAKISEIKESLRDEWKETKSRAQKEIESTDWNSEP